VTLGHEPIRFPYALNYRFTIGEPGHYTITARTGNIVTSSTPLEQERAMEVISNPLEIDVTQDERWSSEQLRMAVTKFEAAERNYRLERWDQRQDSTLQPEEFVRKTSIAKEMNDSGQAIRFLDTGESLQEAIGLYDGSTNLATYANPFWNAILESRHRKLAVRLLAQRMLEGDFIVSRDFLDALTAMSIQQEQPEVFERDDEASRKQLSIRTREILKDYVLALGKSLLKKDTNARDTGIETFEHYVGQKYCADEPLIEENLARQFVAKARTAQP
jgi:hypothetical protein